jgi:hypothetical protein
MQPNPTAKNSGPRVPSLCFCIVLSIAPPGEPIDPVPHRAAVTSAPERRRRSTTHGSLNRWSNYRSRRRDFPAQDPDARGCRLRARLPLEPGVSAGVGGSPMEPGIRTVETDKDDHGDYTRVRLVFGPQLLRRTSSRADGPSHLHSRSHASRLQGRRFGGKRRVGDSHLRGA